MANIIQIDTCVFVKGDGYTYLLPGLYPFVGELVKMPLGEFDGILKYIRPDGWNQDLVYWFMDKKDPILYPMHSNEFNQFLRDYLFFKIEGKPQEDELIYGRFEIVQRGHRIGIRYIGT